MDVMVFVSGSAETVNANDPGSPGGCDVELNIASFIISVAAVIFLRRKKGESGEKRSKQSILYCRIIPSHKLQY